MWHSVQRACCSCNDSPGGTDLAETTFAPLPELADHVSCIKACRDVKATNGAPLQVDEKAPSANKTEEELAKAVALGAVQTRTDDRALVGAPCIGCFGAACISCWSQLLLVRCWPLCKSDVAVTVEVGEAKLKRRPQASVSPHSSRIEVLPAEAHENGEAPNASQAERESGKVSDPEAVQTMTDEHPLAIAACTGCFVAAYRELATIELAGGTADSHLDADSIERVRRIGTMYDHAIKQLEKHEESKCEVTGKTKGDCTFGFSFDKANAYMLLTSTWESETIHPLELLAFCIHEDPVIGEPQAYDFLVHKVDQKHKADNVIITSIIDVFDEPSAPGKGILVLTYSIPPKIMSDDTRKWAGRKSFLSHVGSHTSAGGRVSVLPFLGEGLQDLEFNGIPIPPPMDGFTRSSAVFGAHLITPLKSGGVKHVDLSKFALPAPALKMLSWMPKWTMKKLMASAMEERIQKLKSTVGSKQLADKTLETPFCEMYARLRNRINAHAK